MHVSCLLALQINMKGQIRLSRRAVLLEDGGSIPSNPADAGEKDGVNGTAKDPSKPQNGGSANKAGYEQNRRRDVAVDSKKYIRKD